MAAIDAPARALRRLAAGWRALLGGLLAGGAAGTTGAATLPEDQAEALIHHYDGGGVRASGPALLVRKSLADKVSLSAQLYVDMVSNASIDVVTTASPFKETRRAWELGAKTVVRDGTLNLGLSRSDEPDYHATSLSLDSEQEVFGGMSTVSLGFTRGRDQVGKTGLPGWADEATHWKYRAGLTQVLTPGWLAGANFEVVADSGFLGSPYRAARVFGAAVPERVPRTRTGRALKLSSITDTADWLPRSSLRAEYRIYWDTWDLRAHTTELGASRYLGPNLLLDASVRLYTQGKALFYSDNALAEALYVSRNRQLSALSNRSLALRLSYNWPGLPPGHEIRIGAAYERMQFRFDDFTDLRSGRPYAYNANVLQATVAASF